MNLALVRQRLAAAAADAYDGLTTYGYVPNEIHEPAFIVCESDIEFDKHAFNGKGDEAIVTCRLLVSRGDDIEGQATLDAYLGRGDRSIKLALEAARGAPGQAALDGACDDFHVVRVQGYRIYEHNGMDYYGAEIVVRVIGEGDGE